jgi:beta-adrenergic-receptor kinase
MSVHANAIQLQGADVQEVLNVIGASTSSVQLSDTMKNQRDETLNAISGEMETIAVLPHTRNAPTKDDDGSWDHLAISDTSLFDKLDQAVFSRLKSRHRSGFTHSAYYDRYVYTMIQCEKPVVYDDFVLFRTLGRGGFGLVNGCKKAQSGQLYAIKQLDRRRIKKKNAANLCLNERNILEKVSSPFIVCMQFAFTSSTELYIILDLMVGGDLAFHLHQRGLFSPSEVKYYTARTVLGIKALHDIGVVYRDLKPDNILMDYKGRTKLSDLG